MITVGTQHFLIDFLLITIIYGDESNKRQEVFF